MKRIGVMLYACFYLFSGIGQVETITLSAYQHEQPKTIKIEVPFAQSLSYENFQAAKKELKVIEGKQIVHIDLVYTKFRESSDFNQQALNENRMNRLKKFLPQIKTDLPKWTAFEQTGATERDDAKKYFHGFVLHYGNKYELNAKGTWLQKIEKPFSTQLVNNQNGARLHYTSGSYLHIPANAVVDKQGTQISGEYQIHYREFRNEGEMALSGIPMFYDEYGVEEVFNSVGMYEIRATSLNGDTLVLEKPIIVDFQVTEILPEVSFFSMNDDGHWKKEAAIDFPANETMQMTMELSMDLDLGHKISIHQHRPTGVIDQGGYQGYSRINKAMAIDKDQVYCMLNRKSWNKLSELRMEVDSIHSMIQAEDKEERGVIIPRLKAVGFLEAIIGESIDNMNIERVQQTTVYRSGKTANVLKNVLGDEPIPYAPGLVKGLESPSFGVYNCDQTKRIEDPVAIQPTYIDRSNGKRIDNLYSASVIDLNLNAALSYHPNHLVCNKQGETKLVLFTEDNQIFLFDNTDFQSLPLDNGPIQLKVHDVTNQVKNPVDLQQLLGL